MPEYERHVPCAAGVTSSGRGGTRRAFAVHATWSQSLFIAAALWGAALFWIAEHPPMVDLPQHAGQVALLRDLLFGQSPWAGELQINWLTPYLLGYGLALPLSLAMPAGAALKLLLTLAYLAFVVLCVKLARHFGSDRRLDALFLVSFFGLAWHWGFATFLVTAPLVLAFILMASHYARSPSPRLALLVFTLGMLLLFSHGLGFVFGCSVGAVMMLSEHLRRPRALLVATLPYAALAAAALGLFLFGNALEDRLNPGTSDVPRIAFEWKRLVKSPLYSLVGHGEQFVHLAPLALLLFVAPFLMGLRMRVRNWRAMVPLVVVGTIMLVVPAGAFGTGFLYERFGLFLLPAWAWAFPAAAGAPGGHPAPRSSAAASFLVLACCAALAYHSTRIWSFGKQTEGVDALLRQLEPGQRMLTLPFDSGKSDYFNRMARLHYAGWYQADSGGFADFNFAWFRPQIVRFQIGRQPKVTEDFSFEPQAFDWHRHEGWRYRYFLASGPVPAGLFRGASCPPAQIFADATFTVFENRVPAQATQAEATRLCAPR
jgi:hypothetical protein